MTSSPFSRLALGVVTLVVGGAARANEDPAGLDSGALDTVIVTAEKLGRSLMQTPTSTIVVDQRELERRAGLTTTRDLLDTIPNIVITGTGNTAPVVRGKSGKGQDFTLSACRLALRQAPGSRRLRWIVWPESGRNGRQPLVPAEFFACGGPAASHVD